MIVITFALGTESRSFAAQVAKPDSDLDVVIVHTGVGRKSAAAKIEEFLNKTKPRLLVSSGFAGGAANDLSVGDLILAENFSDPQLVLEADRALQKFRPRTGKLFSADSIAEHSWQRDEIARAHGAIAIDMETETIATACRTREIPFLSLRVISDTARQPFPAPPAVLFDLERQRTDYARLIVHLLTHPRAVSGLIRFSRGVRQAQERLTQALTILLKDDVFAAA